MHFNASAEYPASPTKVAQMFVNPEFVERKIAASGATDASKEITGDPAGAFTVSTTRTLPATVVPEQYRKFVSGGVTLTFTEAWNAPDDDGSRTGILTLKIAGAPASASGTCTLASSAKGAELTYDGDVKVSIPLMGPKIERAVVDAVAQVVHMERDVALEWLTPN